MGALAIFTDRLISARQEARIASAQQQAEQAREGAAKAEKGTAEALAEAAKLNERAGGLELEAAQQRERAARAEKELLELQEKLKPRRIVADQRARLIAILRSAPKGPVKVTCVLGDGEGFNFAGEVVGVLQAAGWEVDGVNQGVFTPTNPVGLFVRVRSPANVPPYAPALLQAFNSVGLRLDWAEGSTVAENRVEIIVGNKR